MRSVAPESNDSSQAAIWQLVCLLLLPDELVECFRGQHHWGSGAASRYEILNLYSISDQRILVFIFGCSTG